MKKNLIIICLSWALIGMAASYASAYSAKVSFYFDYIDFDTGEMEYDPNILVVLFGENDEIEQLLTPPSTFDNFNPDPGIDAHFEYNPLLDTPILFIPEYSLEVAVSQSLLSDLHFSDITDLSFQPLTLGESVGIDIGDTLFIKSEGEVLFAVEFLGLENFEISIATQSISTPESTNVPEPSSWLLFAVGIVVLGMICVRQIKSKRLFIALLLVLTIILIPSLNSFAWEPKGYMVVTTNAILSRTTKIEEFKSHKESRGFDVYIATEDDWDTITEFSFPFKCPADVDAADCYPDRSHKIRQYLINMYRQLNIEYALLIGNPDPLNGDVPMKMLWPRKTVGDVDEDRDRQAPSDLYYADLEGNWDLNGNGYYGEWGQFNDKNEDLRGDFYDKIPELGVNTSYDIIVGRIPYYGNFDNYNRIDDLEHILDKIMAYENASDIDWRKKLFVAMYPLNDSIIPSYKLGELIKHKLLPLDWESYRIYNANYENSFPEDTFCTYKHESCSGVTNENFNTMYSENFEKVRDAWNAEHPGVVVWATHGSEVAASNIMSIRYAKELDDNFPAFIFQASCNNATPESYDSQNPYSPYNLSAALLVNGAVSTIGATRTSQGMNVQANGANDWMAYEYIANLLMERKESGRALLDTKISVDLGEKLPDSWSAEQKWQNHALTWKNVAIFNLYGDPSISPFKVVFADVPSTHWAYQDINSVYDAKITTGCNSNPLQFCPDKPTNRAEASAFLIRAIFGETFDYNVTPVFQDVPSDSWMFKYVQKLYEEGITNGCNQSPLLYCPERELTGDEMATLVIRAKFGEDFEYDPIPHFSDVPDDHWAFKYIQKMYDERLTLGCTQEPLQFCPDIPITRDRMAAFIARAFLEIKPPLQLVVKKGGSGDGIVQVGDWWECAGGCKELKIPAKGENVGFVLKVVTADAFSYFDHWETLDGRVLEKTINVKPGDTIIAVFNRK